jgi:hypothetical protein
MKIGWRILSLTKVHPATDVITKFQKSQYSFQNPHSKMTAIIRCWKVTCSAISSRKLTQLQQTKRLGQTLDFKSTNSISRVQEFRGLTNLKSESHACTRKRFLCILPRYRLHHLVWNCRKFTQSIGFAPLETFDCEGSCDGIEKDRLLPNPDNSKWMNSLHS